MPVSISGIRSASSIGVAQGGTGASSLTEGGVLIGHGSNPVTSITGSDGQVLTWSDSEGSWIAAEPTGGAGGGGGIASVTTSGNLQGNGTAGSPVTLKANISLTSVTASLKGDGSQITGLTAAQVSGIISSVSSSGNLQGDGTSGSPLTLKDNISLTSVSASFNGDGAGISGLASSQLSDFNSAVDARLTNIPNNALQNSSITINGSAISLGGSVTVADSSTMSFTAAGFAIGDVVALSGSLVKADYSDDTKSNAFGVVSAVAGTSVSVKVFGEVTALSASNYATAGTLVYVGPSGSVVNFASIPSGKYITQVGIISPSSGKVIIQPRIFGQKN